jgi:mycothione reductase
MIAASVRTKVPDVPGLKESEVLTSENVFGIERLPGQLVILGGGYKACEFAHFFSAFGTQVTIVGHNPRLLPKEELEVSELVKKVTSKYVDVRVNQDVVEIKQGRRRKTIVHRDRTTGAVGEIEAEEILVTTGVKSNSDLLKPEASGIAVDENGYIIVNEFLETNVPGIWAFGDIIGRNMYRHAANYESDVAWSNAFGMQKVKLDEHAVPHAVFSYRQVASVGMTEDEARGKGLNVLIGSNVFELREGICDGGRGELRQSGGPNGNEKDLGRERHRSTCRDSVTASYVPHEHRGPVIHSPCQEPDDSSCPQ